MPPLIIFTRTCFRFWKHFQKCFGSLPHPWNKAVYLRDFFDELLLLLLLSRFSRIRLCATPYTAAHQAPRPWDSPGKNTGLGCHFLLQCMKVKSESEVAQSCPTPSDPMDCSPPGSSIHGIDFPGNSTRVGCHCLL